MAERKWAFDYKKEYRELYVPKTVPGIVKVPTMNYIAVRGQGDPDAAVKQLYRTAYMIKACRRYGYEIPGYFDYVIPPLESLQREEDRREMHCGRREESHFIFLLRLPYFVSEKDLDWAAETAAAGKKEDFARMEFFTCHEGLCVQCMHIGSRDSAAETIGSMHRFMTAQGYEPDTGGARLYHEIYLSRPGRIPEERQRTVLRQPVICSR